MKIFKIGLNEERIALDTPYIYLQAENYKEVVELISKMDSGIEDNLKTIEILCELTDLELLNEIKC